MHRAPTRAAAFLRCPHGFTGAEKALLLCFGLAIVALLGHLVGRGGQRAAADAAGRLRDNPLVSSRIGIGLEPMHAAAMQVPARPGIAEAPASPASPEDFERRIGFVHFGPQKPLSGPGVLADIEAHLPASYGATYRDANPVTWGHETTHGINSHLRRMPELNPERRKVNGFYVGDDRAMVIEEPPITKSSVAPFVPADLRGFRFGQYVTGQPDFEHEPLYLLDEWTAYVNGSRVAVELAKAGRWSLPNQDAVAGTLEFTGYAFGVAMAAEAQHPGYLAAHPKLKDFIGWQALRALDLYREGAKLPQFGGFSEQQRLYRNLRESPGAQPVRDFIRTHYGDAYLERLLNGQAPAPTGPAPAPSPGPAPAPAPPIRPIPDDGWRPAGPPVPAPLRRPVGPPLPDDGWRPVTTGDGLP